MLDELLTLADAPLLDDEDAEEGGYWFRVSAVKHQGANVSLEISCRRDVGNVVEEQVWEVTGRLTRRWSFSQAAVVDRVELLLAHPLLLDDTAPHCELFFSCRPDDSLAVLGELYAKHFSVLGGWIAFNRYVRADLVALLDGGHGSIASGPEPVIQAYATGLAARGVRHSMTPPRPPSWWDGQRWVPKDPPPQLLLVGESYVIAESFDAVRVSVSSKSWPE